MKNINNKKYMIIGICVGLISFIGTISSPHFLAGFQYPVLYCYAGYVIDRFVFHFNHRHGETFKTQMNKKSILIHALIVFVLIGANIFFSKKSMEKYIEKLQKRNEEMNKHPELFFKK